MNNLYDGVVKAIEKNQKQEISSGEITSIDTSSVSVRLDGAKRAMLVPKPANFSGARGDSCSLARNPHTRQWEIVEVKGDGGAVTVNPRGEWQPFITNATYNQLFFPLPLSMETCTVEFELWSTHTALEAVLIGLSADSSQGHTNTYTLGVGMNGAAATAWGSIAGQWNPGGLSPNPHSARFKFHFQAPAYQYTNNKYLTAEYNGFSNSNLYNGQMLFNKYAYPAVQYLMFVRSGWAAIDKVNSRYRIWNS